MFQNKGDWYYSRLAKRALGDCLSIAKNVRFDFLIALAMLVVAGVFLVMGNHGTDWPSLWLGLGGIVLVLAIVFVVALFKSPVELDRTNRSEIRELTQRNDAFEEKMRPKLVATCGRLDAFTYERRGVVLVASNDGEDEIVDCYAQVLEFLQECSFPNSEPHVDYIPWHKNEDIYLRWRNKSQDERFHRFRTSATVDVAADFKFVGKVDASFICAVGDNTPYHLSRGGIYFLTIEMGAANSTPERSAYRLKIPQGDLEEFVFERIDWDDRPRRTLREGF